MKPCTDPAAEILRATLFAARAHAGQARKGAAAEPYVNHVIEVAGLLADHSAPLPAILAGLLHDTVEDTDCTHADLVAAFGEDVAAIVAEATDDKSLSRCRSPTRPRSRMRRSSSSWPTRSPTCGPSPTARRPTGTTRGAPNMSAGPGAWPPGAAA